MCQPLEKRYNFGTKKNIFCPLWEQVAKASLPHRSSILTEQLGVTYLVTHHLMLRIPSALCQVELINIFLHFNKSINSRLSAFYTFMAELNTSHLKAATYFRRDSKTGHKEASARCVGRCTNPDSKTPPLTSHRFPLQCFPIFFFFFACWFSCLICLKCLPDLLSPSQQTWTTIY